MIRNVKKYAHCIFTVFLIFVSQGLIGQINKIKSESDLPSTTYSTLILQAGDSIAIIEWAKKTAGQELERDDSIVHKFSIIDPNIQRQLFKNRVYCNFILENWDSTLTAIEQYKLISGAPPYWRKTNFVQILAYAQSKKQTGAAFTDNYISLFYKTLEELKQNDKEGLVTGILTSLENSPGILTNEIEKSKKDSVITGSNLSSLLETIVFTQIAKDIVPSIKIAIKKKEEERYFIDAHLRIPLRNGLKLSGILVLPKGIVQPLPAILVISCYAENEKLINEIRQTKKIADEGFAGLMVFSRGKAFSEGFFDLGENEPQDNYDIIDWISRQKWCTGKIGMVGGSYAGQMQWQSTVKLHPALKTIVPQAAAYNGIDVPFLNGVFQSTNLSWLIYTGTGKYDNVFGRNDEEWNKIYSTYLTKGIAFNRLDSIENGGRNCLFQRMLLHPLYDEYWKKMSPDKKDFEKIDIPVLTMTGYFDEEQRGAIGYYNMHQKYGPKGTKANHYLFIGPFDHAGSQGFPSTYIYPYIIDSTALIDQNEMVYQWFNHVLKKGKKPAFLKDRIAVFALGENKWHFFPDLKAMNKDTLTYFLAEKDELNLNDFHLTTGEKSAPGIISMKFNTAETSDDTLQVYSGINSLVTEKIFSKKNKLVFKTDRFASDIILNGTISADLFLSLSVPDADIMLSWWEEDIEGKLWPLSQTVQRLSYCFNKSKRTLWKNDKVYHISLHNAYWMTKQLKKGSRLVMTFSPLADMQWEKNYGSGKEVSTETIKDGKSVLLKIYIGAKYPSNIKVPII